MGLMRVPFRKSQEGGLVEERMGEVSEVLAMLWALAHAKVLCIYSSIGAEFNVA